MIFPTLNFSFTFYISVNGTTISVAQNTNLKSNDLLFQLGSGRMTPEKKGGKKGLSAIKESDDWRICHQHSQTDP
jgi:hypothetical protein